MRIERFFKYNFELINKILDFYSFAKIRLFHFENFVKCISIIEKILLTIKLIKIFFKYQFNPIKGFTLSISIYN